MSRVSHALGSLEVLSTFAVLFFRLGASSYAQMDDEAQIRALEDRFADAFEAIDVDRIMANYEHSQDLVFFALRFMSTEI